MALPHLPEIATPEGKTPEPLGAIPKPLGVAPEPLGVTPQGLAETGHAIVAMRTGVARTEVEVAETTKGTPTIKDGTKELVETKVKWNNASRPIFKTLWCLASTFVAALRVPST